jgi:hypothetical protein
MADWHLRDLENALTAAGWRIVEVRGSDGHRIAGEWDVQRSTNYPPIPIRFDGFDELRCLPLEEAYACEAVGVRGGSIRFVQNGAVWEASVTRFVALLESSLDRGHSDFTLEYRVSDFGSAVVDVYGLETHVVCLISCIGPNALADLARIAIAMISEPASIRGTCAWADEPGEYRWIVERRGGDVSVRIVTFGQTYSTKPDEAGDPFFEARCTLTRFVNQIFDQMRYLRLEMEEDEYLRRWRSAFPVEEYDELRRLLRRF